MKKYIENEEFDLERIEKDLDNLKKKWFKNSKIDSLIKFLEQYIEIKKSFINKLKKLSTI